LVLAHLAKSRGVVPEDVAQLDFNVRKLEAGRIDLCEMLDYSFSWICKQEGLNYSDYDKAWLLDDTKKYYIALNINTPMSIVNAMQKSLEKMKQNGVLEKIVKKYL